MGLTETEEKKEMRNPFKRKDERALNNVALVIGGAETEDGSLCVPGYTSLARCPEVLTACRTIAELIGSITIYLMNNTELGDERIVNELSKTIDINPMPNMTRANWMSAIVMNLLLYGKGNSIVMPHTHNGYLESLEPIAARRVGFKALGTRDYRVLIDGKPKDPNDLLHFVLNPDENQLWRGKGLTISIRDAADNLRQAAATEKGFLASKWKPSLIVKVDAMIEEFSGAEGRKKLMQEYVSSAQAGEPWMIPAEQFSVEQVKPLSLADLAIKDTVELDKRTIASAIGVPPFILGVGEYSQAAWNNFIQNRVRIIATTIQQELTKKLILSPNWYLKFNTLALMDWDLMTISSVFGGLADKGFITGNEVRDRLGLSPLEGLDELRILENYIPVNKIGDQAKLLPGGDD